MPRRSSDADRLANMLNLPKRTLARYAANEGQTGRFSGWVSKVMDWISGRSRRSIRRSEVPPEVWRSLDKITQTNGPARIEPAPPPVQPGFQTMRREPPRPGEDPSYGRETLVTNSSNVYSYSYDASSSTLYVTYLAPKINPDAVRTSKVVKGRGQSRTQLIGQSGKTLSGKSNSRGAMYAYYDVPARVYDRMVRASSKGKFVWDELRIRGTMYGHKFRYGLVQGAVITQPGVSGVYIPRRATEAGFRTRSVADIGQGARGFQTSTLAEQKGFRTRRSPSGRGQMDLGME